MIMTAKTIDDVMWNKMAILWRGKNIRIEDARRDFKDYKDSGGLKDFEEWVFEAHYHLIHEEGDV